MEEKLNTGSVKDQAVILGAHLEYLTAKDVVPHLSLCIPVDQVALLEWQQVEEP